MIKKNVPLGKKKQRLGELLIERKLLTPTQLKEALKRQAWNGGHLGSILVEMGYITTEDLLEFLNLQFGIPSANLLESNIVPEIVSLMPIDQIRSMKVVPVGRDNDSITLAMINPLDTISIKDIEFSLGKKVKPVVVPSSQMESVIETLTCKMAGDASDRDIRKEKGRPLRREAPSLSSLLQLLVRAHDAELLLCAGAPPSLKSREGIRREDVEELKPADCERYARELTCETEEDIFSRDACFAMTYSDIGRFRVHMYSQRSSISLVIRRIPDIVASCGELGLPEWTEKYLHSSRGLILVCGPRDSGKTTTLASFVDHINSSRGCNIITLEDPIEYLHTHKKSNVNQRAVGMDIRSFQEGMKHILRESPDVVILSEIPDEEICTRAIHAVEAGCLLLTSVAAPTIESAIERLGSMFPPMEQQRIRTTISRNLLFALGQRLVPSLEGDGRMLAYEKLVNSSPAKDFPANGKDGNILDDMDDSAYSSLESSLSTLCVGGSISFAAGLEQADNKDLYKTLVLEGGGTLP